MKEYAETGSRDCGRNTFTMLCILQQINTALKTCLA